MPEFEERSVEEKVEDTQVGTVAIAKRYCQGQIAYYLYRQAGCPYGVSYSAFDAWFDACVKQPFAQLVENK